MKTHKHAVGYKPYVAQPYRLKLSVGHLRAALEGLPDDMMVGPEYVTHVPDEWPVIVLQSFGVDTNADGHRRFCFGIEPIALEDAEAMAEVEKSALRERARYDRYHTPKKKPKKKSE